MIPVLCWLEVAVLLGMGGVLTFALIVGGLIMFDEANMKPAGWAQYAALVLLILGLVAGVVFLYLERCCSCLR